MPKPAKYNDIILAIIVYVIWVLGFSFYNYQKSKSDLYGNLEAKLLTAARNYSYIIPDNLHHKNMSESDLSFEQDRSLLVASNKYTKINKVTYIYSMIKVDNKIFFTMGNAAEEDMAELKGKGGYYFYPYDEAESHIFRSFYESQPIFHDTVDHWGSFRSVFIPYTSQDGTKFVIGADISIDYIDALLKDKIIDSFMISLFFLVFVLPVVIAFTSQVHKWAASLKEQTSRANAANKAKSTFLSHMSHELRTPLHGIIAFSLLGVESNEEGKNKEYFSNISKSGERLKMLLDNLLDVSKFEEGKVEMRFKNEDIRKLIFECVKEQQGRLTKNKVEVSVIEKTNNCYADCDAYRISQVILNLLNNAIKFSPENTTIKLIISSVTDNKSGKIQELEVSISDQGRGVPEENREDIFDKFTQALSSSDKVTGTGLGLAVCREIMQAHGGSIWCQDAESGGAEFIFRIPVVHS